VPAGSVSYFEAHGTCTPVGDAVELSALATARREAPGEAPVAVVSSIKPNIGHTKAAAGIAGLIKAAMALHTQVLPPLEGYRQPSPTFQNAAAELKTLATAEVWP
jgi:enediyne polyketide synthase